MFDPSDSGHKKIADLAQKCEKPTAITARKYYTKEKSLLLVRIDDSVESPEVACSNARVFRTRLAEICNKELEKLEDLIKFML